jgi:CubicO group peptidase (beta-lactamase class C family)
MKKTLWLPLFLILAVQARPANKALESRADEVFAPWDSTSSPGCALAVIRDGDIVYSRGYGMANLEHAVAITPSTAFYAGSVSKQFVAASIALLSEEGALSLDDDIRKYVPEIPEYGQTITIRSLVHHTSGLRDYLTLMSLAGRNFADSASEEEVLALIARQKELNFEPGAQYLYSNSGYFLLAQIVKRASGKTLREYAEEKIFAPLSMTSSHFHDDLTMFVSKRAEGHLAGEDGDWELTRSRFALVGSGGLFTTVEDLFLWDQNFYENRLGKGGPEFIYLIHTEGKLNDGEELDYAFGLTLGEYRGLGTVRHGGALGGYRSHLLRFPDERFSVAIACNLDQIDPGNLADRIADIYLEDKLEPPEPPTSPERDEKQGDAALVSVELSEYAGTYWSEELQVLYRLFIEDEELFLRIGWNPKTLLRPVEKDVLVFPHVKAVFERDRHDAVTGFVLDAGRVRDLRFVKREELENSRTRELSR